eukprot:8307426-Alexandrium_andersonii.AAC.1
MSSLGETSMRTRASTSASPLWWSRKASWWTPMARRGVQRGAQGIADAWAARGAQRTSCQRSWSSCC